jgi:hypothetical protein
MINNNRLVWLVSALGAAAFSMTMITACGDDGGTPPDDVDAPPDEPCVGHQCPPSNPVLMSPEVGLLRAELYHFGANPDGTRNEALGAWAFFFENQNPPYRSILGPVIDTLTPTNATCFDNRVGDALVNGYSPRNQEIMDTREYFDLGPSITISPAAGGEDIIMTRYTAAADGDAARDPTNQLLHKVIYKSELSAAAALQRNATYNMPVIPPDEAIGFPGLDLRGGFDIPGSQDFAERTPTLYVPPNFTLDNEADFYAAGGFVIDPTVDLTMGWTIDDGDVIAADWPTTAQFTAFASVDADGRPQIQYICVGPSAAGSHTIPADLFTMPDFPQSGLILQGMFAHVAWATPWGDAEGHFGYLGVNCDLGPFSLATP